MPLAMNMNLRNFIDEKVNMLGDEAIEVKGLILTETDLQCALYRKLYEIEELINYEPTNDEGVLILSHKLHTEITWYDNEGKLRIRPDITLMDPSSLTILSGVNGTRLPSKGFQSTGGGIIFELKFDRNKQKISQQTIDGIFKDIRNYKKLLDKFNDEGVIDEMYGYFIFFIKSSESEVNQEIINEIQEEFDTRGIDPEKYSFIYKFLDVP